MFATFSEIVTVDTETEPAEEKTETPVKCVFVELKSEHWLFYGNTLYSIFNDE